MKLIVIVILLFMKIIQLDCFKKEIIQSFANRNKYNCIVLLTTITNEFYGQKALLELTKSLSSTILIPIIIINLRTEQRNLKLIPYIHVCSKPLISVDSENSMDITEKDVFFTSPLSGSLWLMFLPENFIVERIFSGIIIPKNVEVIIAKKNNSSYNFWHVYRPGLQSPLIMRYYGNWTLPNRLMVPHQYLLWQKVTLNGIALRAATFKTNPFVNISFRTNYKYLMLIWLILENCLNFTTKYVPCVDNNWGYLKINGNVTEGTGIIGMLIRKEADVSLLGFTLTSNRIGAIAYNIVLTQTRFQVYIKRDQNESKHWIRWWFSPLTTNSWYCVIGNVLLIIAGVQLFSFVNKKFRIVYQQYPLDAIFQILTIIFQPDTPRIPMLLSIQLAFLCASIFSMIINMMYSASLISSLTVHYYTPPFISLEGLLNDGSYKFGVNAISAEYTVHYQPINPFLIKLKEVAMEKSVKKLPRSYIEGLTRVCNDNKYAFMANDEILEELQPQLKCQFYTLPKDIYQVNTAYVMNKNNPYVTVINYKLMWMIETGITQRLTNIIKPKKRTFTNSQPWRSVELEDLYLLYIILGMAINIAFLMLLIEIIIHRYRKWKTI